MNLIEKNSKIKKNPLLALVYGVLLFTIIPSTSFAAYILLDAPESVYNKHYFDVDVYLFDVSDMYGAAYDVLYDELLVDVKDADTETLTIEPDMTEGDFLNESGTVETIMRGALEDALQNGILVFGLVRSGNVFGVDSSLLPVFLNSFRFRAMDVGYATFAFDRYGLVDSDAAAISIAGATGTIVHILPFLDTAPEIPSNPFPADDSIDVPLNVDLSWDGGDQDVDDEVTYVVYFGETNPPTTAIATIKKAWNELDCTASAPLLEMSKHYYWQVVATDFYDEKVTQGPVWEFDTINPTATPTQTPTPTDTPTPTITPTLQYTYTRTMTPTVTKTPTPAPVPTVSTFGLILMVMFLSLSLGHVVRRKK